MSEVKPASALGRLAGDTFAYNLAALVGAASSILLVPLLTRRFTPDVYGVADTALQVAASLSTLLILGMDSAVAREYFDTDSLEHRGRSVGLGLAFLTATGFLGSAVAIGFARGGAVLFLGSERHAGLLRLALLSVPFIIYESYLRNLLRWRRDRWGYFVLAVFGGLGRFALTFGLAVVWGLPGIVAGASAGCVAAGGLGFALARRSVGRPARAAALPGMLRFGLPMAALGLAWPVSLLIDRAVIVHWQSAWQMGVYAAALKLAVIYTILTEGVRQSWGPIAFAQWSSPRFSVLFGFLVEGYVLASVAAACLVSLIAPDLAAVFLGPAYREAHQLLAALLGALLAADLFNLFGIGLYYRRWGTRFALLGWAAVGATLLGDLLLVPVIGPIGAALSNASARALAAVVVLFVSQRALRVEHRYGRLAAALLTLPAVSSLAPFLGLPGRLATLGVTALWLGALTLSLLRRYLAFERREGVLFLLTNLEVGGVEIQTREIAGALAQAGTPVTVLALRGLGPVADLGFHPGVRLIACHKRSRFDLAGAVRVLRELLSARAAVVHALLFEGRVWGAVASALSGARLVVSERDLSEYRGLHRRVFAWTVARAEACLVSTEATARHLERRYGISRSKLRVVPNAIPEGCWLHRWIGPRPDAQRPRLAVVGRLEHPKKGHVPFFDALARLRQSGLAPLVEIIGDGPDRAQLEEHVRSLGLSEQVRFLGSVTPAWQPMSRCDVIVVPSLYEGFGNVIVEAMAIGTPLVATACGGPSELVVDGETGLLVPPGDVLALARAIEAVLRDPATAAARAARARSEAAGRFGLASVVARLRQVYEDRSGSGATAA